MVCHSPPEIAFSVSLANFRISGVSFSAETRSSGIASAAAGPIFPKATMALPRSDCSRHGSPRLSESNSTRTGTASFASGPILPSAVTASQTCRLSHSYSVAKHLLHAVTPYVTGTSPCNTQTGS